MSVNQIQAVIFDWAGTVVDYGCFAPVTVFVEVFASRGITVTMEEARTPMGLAKKDHIRALCGMELIARMWESRFGMRPSAQDEAELYAEFEPMLMDLLPRYTELIPGVLPLMERLRGRGLLIGSTTGYTSEMMRIVAEGARAQGYAPDCLVTPTDVPAGRPHPWMIYQNAIQLGVYPMRSIVKVGDTISDIQEGVNAGAWSVGVVLGGSELGLSEDEVKRMDPAQLELRIEQVERRMRAAGAHEVIRSIGLLDEALDRLEMRT
jgi:phosphonoacetaldehyde hydrolase